MTIRDIAVLFGYEIDRNSEKQAENSIKGIKNLATKLLGSIGIVLSVTGISSLAEAAADVNALKSQFSQVFGEMETDADGKLEAIEKKTGILKDRMKGNFSQIAAFAKTTGMETSDALGLADRAMTVVADSAAYYDKSLENVTNSLQSFLKGNFENDAALGLSCTETTRNTAANELYGKSFKDLAESEKQLTLLKMVEDANKASGALGQAARESDTWTNQLGNLKQSIKDLKASAGAGFLQPAVKVLKLLTSLAQGAAKGIQEITGENGTMTESLDSLFALVKKLKPSADRMLQTLTNGMKSGVQKLGGVRNALKLARIVAGAFVIALNWSKIIGGAGKFISLLKSMTKFFSTGNIKLLGLVAVIVLLALIVEDFINFMKGNDSVIGHCFEQAGIDADKMRAKVKNIFENLKAFFSGIWNAIKTAGAPILESIKKMIEGVFGADLFAGLGEGVAGIIELIERISAALAKNQGLQDFLGKAVVGIISVIMALKTAIPIVKGVISLIGIVKNVISGVSAVIGFLTSPVGLVVAAIVALIAIGILLYKNWDKIKEYALSIWAKISSAFQAGSEKVKAFLRGVVEFVKNNWQGLLLFLVNPVAGAFKLLYDNCEGFRNFINQFLEKIKGLFDASGIPSAVSNMGNAIKNGIQGALDWIRGLPKQALQWGVDIITGIADGITGAIGKVSEAVKGVASKITSYLHFSVPDEGPLTDFPNWMPDFMQGLAGGISDNESVVMDKVRKLASGISALTKVAVAQPATATASTVNNRTSNVMQNVNIDNTYSGGTVEAQKAVSKSMKKSATDATTQMARALAYARG